MRPRLALLVLPILLLAIPGSATAHDAFPCGPQEHQAWSKVPVQVCPLGGALNGRVPVYAEPVGHAAGAPMPPVKGWLNSTSGEAFQCQWQGPEFVHPSGWKNTWWARTKSDDHQWGWTPEVFFHGGNDNEKDAGLRDCPAGFGNPDPAPAPAPQPAPRPAPPALAPTSSCTTFRVLGVRGSGESFAGPYDMGGTVGPTAVTTVAQLRADTGKSVSAASIHYPAVGVSASNFTSGRFMDSMHTGERMLRDAIHDYLGRCPDTTFAVIGYSQGAGVASQAMRGLSVADAEHVDALTLYADTYSPGQKLAASRRITFDPFDPDATGVKRYGSGVFGGRSIPDTIAHVNDICFRGDPVCDLNRSPKALAEIFTFKVHTMYKSYGLAFGMLTDVMGSVTAGEMEKP